MIDTQTRTRALMALTGTAAGLSIYGLAEVLGKDLLPELAVVALTVFALVFFTSLMALAGPLSLPRAAGRAAVLATVVAALQVLGALRYDSALMGMQQPFTVVSLILLSSLPLPFLIAAGGAGGWRDYPALFTHAWTILVRFAAAVVFVGLVWAMIFLSDALLGIVGVEVIGDLVERDAVPYLLTGAVLGLAFAVVTELSDYISPHLLLRLLRLFLPVVLAVMVVFLVALLLRGYSALLFRFSAAGTLFTMVGAAVMLISIAVGRSAEDAAHSAIMRHSARGLCLILPVMAAIGAWAVWLRVINYGWTPERVFAAIVAMFALAYGVAYAVSVLRGANWMARIRASNTLLALAMIVIAALAVTPILNPERIAANSQLARYRDGQVTALGLDANALTLWGRAGQDALTTLEDLATQPGNEALAQRLAATDTPDPAADAAAALRALTDILPLQPVTATATRDILLAGMPVTDLQDWARACASRLPNGAPGCVMVVADLWPRTPGEEAMILLNHGGWVQMEGLVMGEDRVEQRQVWQVDGGLSRTEAGVALIAEWQKAPPPLTPVPMNQLGVEGGLMLMP